MDNLTAWGYASIGPVDNPRKGQTEYRVGATTLSRVCWQSVSGVSPAQVGESARWCGRVLHTPVINPADVTALGAVAGRQGYPQPQIALFCRGGYLWITR